MENQTRCGRRFKPENERISGRQTRTPWSAPQRENQTDKRPHRQTANKNSLVCTADGKSDRQTTASADGKQELLGLHRRWKTRRNTGEDLRQKNDRISRRQTNKNSLFCTADGKTRRSAGEDLWQKTTAPADDKQELLGLQRRCKNQTKCGRRFCVFFPLEKTKEERMENQRVEKVSLPQAWSNVCSMPSAPSRPREREDPTSSPPSSFVFRCKQTQSNSNRVWFALPVFSEQRKVRDDRGMRVSDAHYAWNGRVTERRPPYDWLCVWMMSIMLWNGGI